MNIKLRSLLVAFIAISLFFLPFFWFHTGEVDLGGDSSRLYFYDPGAFLKNYAFFGVSPSAYGVENIGYFMVPFVLLLVGMKLIFSFLKYFKIDKFLYLTGVLVITFLFLPNFSFVAAPGFFAFYPLSFLFLFLYRLVILKRRIIVKHLMLFMVALVFLHSLHIIP